MMRFYFLSVALLAGSIIAYEITLVRLFSIAQWHHFAHMIISLALLGFGASGTAISLTQRWLMGNQWKSDEVARRFHNTYTTCGLLYSIGVVGCFVLHQYVPFNPLMLVWQPSQVLSIFVLYLILSLPFFFGAACIGLALLRFAGNVNRLYFFDLFGSGIGALGIIVTMYLIPPAQNLTLISAVGFCAVLIANWESWKTRQWRRIVPITGLAAAFIGYLLFNPISIKISPYKGLSSTLNFPDAQILNERHSPFGLLHVVRSGLIRAVPGLSLNAQQPVQPQLGIFTDADGMTAITDFRGDLSKLGYLGDTTSAVAYHLIELPHVLVLGAGGGGDVLNALYHGAVSVDAVELNPQVLELVAKEHKDFAGHIYGPDSPYPVQVHVAEARGFVRATTKRYDLIQIALLDSVSASAAGTHALSESYLYTVEAFTDLYQHLTPGGIISITRWLKTPPRDMIRLFATAVEALEQSDGAVPAQQLAMIRGWRTGTLLIKKGTFDTADRAAIQNFCRERSFDLAYYPQMPEVEANRYNQLAEPIFFRAAQAILSNDRKQFYEGYPFNIRPTTDNRPYFFQFLRFDSLVQMVRTVGRSAIPFIEWGYLLLIATLIQAVLAGVVLILIPLFFLKREDTSSITHNSRFTNWQVFVYFLSLGVGFMFIEMSFIQKFLLLLANPTYAVAVVLCAFLLFAGLGSLFSLKLRAIGKLRQPPIAVAIGMLSVIALVYLQLLPPIFHRFLASSDVLKIAVSIGLIAPLAFFMGMPFPLGIDRLQRHHPHLIAWAWGINGYASVVSAILATCLAIAFGFNIVILLAVGIYLIGGCVHLWGVEETAP
jgi:spermidine synthase